MATRYRISDGDVELSEHFRLHEFRSRNGADELLVSEKLVECLEMVYRQFNCSAIMIVSGYREQGGYNQSIAGMATDSHTAGIAADIRCMGQGGDTLDNRLVACFAQDMGIGGIGYMGDTIHLDVRHLGGYKNSRWWGDETTGRNDIADWYSYFGLSAADVYGTMQGNVVGTEALQEELDTASLKYEVNRHALTLLGHELDDADDYAGLLARGELDWHEFSLRLQESGEGVRKWIRLYLFVDILHRIPDDSEVDWWYAQYVIHDEMNKALMVREFGNDYEAFRRKYKI
jgi:hypothetical protein